MGLLSCDGPQDWHPADQIVKEKCAQARQYSAVCHLYIDLIIFDFVNYIVQDGRFYTLC